MCIRDSHSPPLLHNALIRCCAPALNASPACYATSTARGCCHHRNHPYRFPSHAPDAAKTARASSTDPRCGSKSRDSGHWQCCCAPSRLHPSTRTRGGRSCHTNRKTRYLPSACHRLSQCPLAPRSLTYLLLLTRSPLFIFALLCWSHIARSHGWTCPPAVIVAAAEAHVA